MRTAALHRTFSRLKSPYRPDSGAAASMGPLPRPEGVRETAGWVSGYGLGMVTAAVSRLRRSRMFHPRGILFEAAVTALDRESPLALSLEGDALVRFSSAWWKQKQWPDVLGVAVRFRDVDRTRTDYQDLLFATIRYPIETPVAPLFTKHEDFLANRYHGVSPFDLPTGERVKIRLRPAYEDSRLSKRPRAERLRERVKEGRADLLLEIRPLRRTGEWKAIARIHPTTEIRIDPEHLEFSPFNNGRGIRPRGYVHFLRVGAYRMGQAARRKYRSPATPVSP